MAMVTAVAKKRQVINAMAIPSTPHSLPSTPPPGREGEGSVRTWELVVVFPWPLTPMATPIASPAPARRQGQGRNLTNVGHLFKVIMVAKVGEGDSHGDE